MQQGVKQTQQEMKLPLQKQLQKTIETNMTMRFGSGRRLKLQRRQLRGRRSRRWQWLRKWKQSLRR